MLSRYTRLLYFTLLLVSSTWSISKKQTGVAIHEKQILLFSTLDGTLVAVDKATGETMWSLKDKPPVTNHLSSSSNYLYLPDPKDGSLYMTGPLNDRLQRLPLTIPELVRISPSRSSDGLLYSASKQDSWIAVDPITGERLYSFSSQGGLEATCPIDNDRRVLHIPQTIYRVAVFDSSTKQIKWNITYTQYESQSYTNLHPQDLLHFCSSSDGSMLSVNALTGDRVWEKSFGSPVVGVYSLEGGQNLRKVPMTSLSHDTLHEITGSTALAIKNDISSLKATDAIMKSSLFLGIQKGQPYAMRSLTDEETIQELPPIFAGLHLIEGPEETPDSTPSIKSHDIVSIGHFPLPDEMNINIEPLIRKLQEEYNHKTSSNVVIATILPGPSEVPEPNGTPRAHEPNSSDTTQSDIGFISGSSFSIVVLIVSTVLFSSLIASIVAVIVAKTTSINQVVHLPSTTPTPDNSKTGSHSNRSHSQSAHDMSTADNISNKELISGTTSVNNDNGSGSFKNGMFHIGKLKYNTRDVIGKGSQGTVVFKGQFESRAIAVKRIIPECFDLADREVALLRESDQHPNVVRYFCMEEDPTFRYLALELCHATLHEYVEGHKLQEVNVNEKQLLWEALCGVDHLHNLGIVHRDIKPQNVLLTLRSSNEVRALISDFGLCRKLPAGRGSFTAQSGVLGTEGWIAPEMFQDRSRVTCAVDIFAMGCVIYYVMSRGSHPYGNSLRRQSNIEAGDFSLSALIGEDRLTVEHLVETMISFNCKFRPSAKEVLCHCLFWSKARQLAFFQDVSDRIEKEPPHSSVVQALERGGVSVVKGDWRDNIGEELRQDLRKFRSYQGTSLRDLLRAMRNKKHHYRELPETLKESLGSIPEGYVTYFTSRFPSLLIHAYKQMEICKNETVFRSYYYTHS